MIVIWNKIQSPYVRLLIPTKYCGYLSLILNETQRRYYDEEALYITKLERVGNDDYIYYFTELIGLISDFFVLEEVLYDRFSIQVGSEAKIREKLIQYGITLDLSQLKKGDYQLFSVNDFAYKLYRM